ncbi:MAG TPA: AEC family transporter [Armatimonadota bacterium]|jgi:predicted permease
MTETTAKTIEAFLVIVLSLAVGYAARKRGRLQSGQAVGVSRAGLTWLTPVVSFLVMWALRPVGWGAAALPMICALCIVLIWLPATLIARRLLSEPREQAAWIISAMFSNQGTTFGVFICFILLGAQGAALGTIYTLPFLPLLYLLGFFIAGRYVASSSSPWQTCIATFRWGYSRNPLLGVLLGLLAHVVAPPPAVALRMIDVLVPLDTAIQLFAIGGNLRLSALGQYVRPIVVMHVVKFVLTPLLGLGLAALLGLWGQADNQLVKIVLIECSAPVAILSIVVAQCTGLKVDVANSLWVTTNLFAAAWVPVLLWVARHL